MTEQTIYQRNPDAWTKIEKAGYTNLAEMARRMASASIMDDALGYRSATSKWSRGKGMPSPDAERRARAYINRTRIIPAGSHTGQPDNLGGAIYLVACPPGTAAKVEKVLGILGCDVTEV